MRVFRIETIGGELAIEMQYIDGIPLSAMLTDLLPGIHGSVTMNPKFMAAPRGFYFLALSDSVAGQQLFYYDHDRVQVRHIADVSEVTSARAVLGNALILSSIDPDHGMEPRIQRSESVGIERLADPYPGSVSSDPNHFFRSG